MQGTVFDQLKQSFHQLLFFVREMRSLDRRPVTFIGIAQTGLTTVMVHRIARAIESLPVNNTTPPTILEMQKVGAGVLRDEPLSF